MGFLLFGEVSEVTRKESDKAGQGKPKKNERIHLSLCKFNSSHNVVKSRQERQANGLEDQTLILAVTVIT